MKLKQSVTESSSVQQADKLFQSFPRFLKLANSMLSSVDRRTAGELAAWFLYFKSQGRTEADFGRFLLANRLDVLLQMIGNSLPVLIPGLVYDKELRSLVVNVCRDIL